MARVSTYLNFPGTTEEAVTFYADVFGSEVRDLMRFADAPGLPPLEPEEAGKVLHVEVDILAGHVIQATDMLASLGHTPRIGNTVTIALEPDTREEADRLYGRLSEGSSEATGMSPMFFGYWGTCLDRFGVRWMINVAP